ncbi:ribonuclease R [Barnesiella sp. CU968]|jgi:ribonuclease R|uniref:ribonuclease R n=1 Tax=Barnesiella sp. CU968 TaxID=2780099 RepID=UPI001957220B|nr:ribonuclease R [Barnesiella sp. CU968]MBJ2198807.1 ribonuclease R [Muribaculaceae bacterium]MCI9030028.1 ribonuclease R [Muribaculaceae bacterium]
MKKSKNNGARRLKKRELQQKIMEFLLKQNKQSFNYKQIAFAIEATNPQSRLDIINLLDELVAAEEIQEVGLGKYKAFSNRGTENVGVFVRRSNGKNAVVIDDEQIMVAERNSMHALNGDKVRVMVSAARAGRDPEAQVIEILEAKDQVFIGTLKVDKTYSALVTDSKFLAADIIIPRNKLKGGKSGDKAIARITCWKDDEMNPRGEVVDILGRKGENTAEMHAILAEFGLPYKYPENVEKAADKIDAGITPEEVAKREDFRNVTTFTIDPRDAKDFDDALSIRQLANGNWEVGVHIADVTHYVRPGSVIDKEAQKRATSVYLVDRTIPMLPERLSNGICSLRPDEEKLTFSAIFELDSKANVVNSRIGRTAIRSDRRLTYEEAQEIIERVAAGEKVEETDADGRRNFPREICVLNELARQLRRRRYDAGALEFDRAEVRFEIDETGKPVSVYFKESKDANKLIEEFMLLANLTVAESIGKVAKGKKAKSFVYRIHENPNPEKIGNLALIASRFGYKVATEGRAKEINKSVNRLLKDVKGKGEENMLSILAIRSMAKAVYTTDNVGHYGLAMDYYTHFTSPIRRYPDMMVHRLLAKYADGGRSVDKLKLEDECRHSSDMEQLAANAERASIRYKQVEFMQDRLGEIYDGVISGVTEWGFYVELTDSMCEGLVPVRDLADDYYDYDEKSYCLKGRRHGNVYTLGDMVKVQVARADLDRKQLDFALISDSGNPNRPLEQRKPGKRNEPSKPKGRGKGKRRK